MSSAREASPTRFSKPPGRDARHPTAESKTFNSLSRTAATATLAFDMVRTCTMPLTDGELRPQLEAGETISFVGGEISLHKIESQVDRLGFGDLYIVSAMQGRQTEPTRIQ